MVKERKPKPMWTKMDDVQCCDFGEKAKENEQKARQKLKFRFRFWKKSKKVKSPETSTQSRDKCMGTVTYAIPNSSQTCIDDKISKPKISPEKDSFPHVRKDESMDVFEMAKNAANARIKVAEAVLKEMNETTSIVAKE